MKSYTLLLAGLVVSLATAAQSENWTLPRANNQLTNATPEEAAVPLSLAWQYVATPAPGNRSQPVVIGDTVFFADGDRLVALDAENGFHKWFYPSEGPLGSPISTSLAAYEGRIYFGAVDGNIYCVSASDGRYIWAYNTLSQVRSSPQIAEVGGEPTLFAGSDNNALHSVRADTGEPNWPGGFRTGDDVTSEPAIDESGAWIYFISRDTRMYAANAQNGKFRWAFRMNFSTVGVNPIIGRDVVYIAGGNQLFSLGARSGVRKWTLTFPGEFSAPPALADQVLFTPLRSAKLYAITARGKVKWEQPADTVTAARAGPMVAGKVLFVGGDKGVVSALDTETGRVLWRYVLQTPQTTTTKPPAPHILASPVYANGTLFVLSDDGVLSAFRGDAPDNAGPMVNTLSPAPGGVISGGPPVSISAVITDIGSGVDPDSVVLTLDGAQVEHKFSVADGKVTYETPVTETQVPLKNGRHQISVAARDWKGNTLDYTWSFTVDNSLPKPRTRAQTKPGLVTPGTRSGSRGSSGSDTREGDRRSRWNRDRRDERDSSRDQDQQQEPPRFEMGPPQLPPPPPGPGAGGGPPAPGGMPEPPSF